MDMNPDMSAYDLLIKDVTILTMDAEGAVVGEGAIGIKDGAIALLEPNRPDSCYAAREVIDARGDGGAARFYKHAHALLPIAA